jgi:hypothetical protein
MRDISYLLVPLRHRHRRHRVLGHIPHHTLLAFHLEPQRTFLTTIVRDLQHLITGVTERVGGVSCALGGGRRGGREKGRVGGCTWARTRTSSGTSSVMFVNRRVDVSRAIVHCEGAGARAEESPSARARGCWQSVSCQYQSQSR